MDKNTQELIDAGNDILKSVSKAIDTNDYSKLASEITNTVKAVSIDRKTIYASGAKPNYGGQQNYGQRSYNARRAPKPFPFLQKRISRYNGLAEIIFGASAEFFILLPLLLGSFFTGSIPFVITMVALCALGGIFTFKGIKKLKLAKKLYQYGNILKNAEYFAITDLAKASVKSDEEVLKDIKALIKEGYLPRAKLDSSETTCMITDAAYEMYLGAEKDRIAREAKQAQEAAVLGRSQAADSSLPANVQQLINEGNEYISFVKNINDIIPDSEEMSNKLYKLEGIMNRIFEQVKKDPSSADELHKLMNYYLPTTKKLLTAYVELDKQPGGGENVQQTKKEIDLAMDTINLAFENLLDSLFQEMAWDISSDISVMKTMMAQDGLTGNSGMAMATASGTATAAMQQEE
ncbi:MAG: 5-bromo-4-chloroindolyl phosphate hydrolysis family protein [Butyrivibrio sp.]|nr:5-bromo-4-chloroindolyl phosphate hydrolysis family protein [Butyrivibrio sp.]